MTHPLLDKPNQKTPELLARLAPEHFVDPFLDFNLVFCPPEVHQKNPEIPICPNYTELSEISQRLAIPLYFVQGLDRFCGSLINRVDYLNQSRFLAGRRGVEYLPRSYCGSLKCLVLNTISTIEDLEKTQSLEWQETSKSNRQLKKLVKEFFGLTGLDVQGLASLANELTVIKRDCPSSPKYSAPSMVYG